MNILNILLTATAAAAALAGFAESVEVVQIKYSDGVIDYIPADEIAKISITKGIDAQSPVFSKVNDMYDNLKAYGQVSYDHYDFGYPAIMMALDARTEDVVGQADGYNHFSVWTNFSRGNLLPVSLMWQYMYPTIAKANDIISTTEANSDENMLMLAQARALRSWAYWNLVQTYAKNPALHPDAEGVIILNGNSIDGSYPLSSLREVYARIMEDIDIAVDDLESIELTAANLNVAQAKRYIDLATAYGLRARYNLTQHRYDEAATDARRAIEASSARPLQMAAAAYPGFNDAKLGNWMWSVILTPQDRAVTSVIVNFPSMMCNFSYGYTSVGCIRGCGTDLHNYLKNNGNDVRLNWFLDSNGQSSNLTRSQQAYINEVLSMTNIRWGNIKFDSYMSKVSTEENANDVPLMRIEEMYLIEAEGLAMSGNTSRALDLLNTFVRTYRNPDYEFTSTTASDIQQEILWQRRAELWGEGIVYFDKLRLELGVDRYNDDNWPESLRYRISGTSRWMLFNHTMSSPLVEGLEESAIESANPVPGSDWNE